jgi:hypothetical protein
MQGYVPAVVVDRQCLAVNIAKAPWALVIAAPSTQAMPRWTC